MPNWTNNKAEFYNDDVVQVEQFVAHLNFLDENKTDDNIEAGLFAYFCPRPASEEDNWYSWNASNWGTKWEASIYSWYRQSENSLVIIFDTAWAPPLAFYDFLENNTDWTVDATYFEGSMGFVGRYSEGFDDYYDYDGVASLDLIPEDLVKEWNLRELFDEDAESPEWKTPEWDTPQENAFNDEVGREWLRELLSESVVKVTFTKKDGSERVMSCTLSENLIPKAPIHATNTNNPIDFPKTRKISTEVQAVFDIEAQSWRSFRWDSIKQIDFALGEENV